MRSDCSTVYGKLLENQRKRDGNRRIIVVLFVQGPPPPLSVLEMAGRLAPLGKGLKHPKMLGMLGSLGILGILVLALDIYWKGRYPNIIAQSVTAPRVLALLSWR